MTNVQQLENVEYFIYVGNLMKSDAHLVMKLNPGLPRQEQKDPFHQKIGLKVFFKKVLINI